MIQQGNIEHIEVLKEFSISLRKHCLENDVKPTILTENLDPLTRKFVTFNDPKWLSWKESHKEPFDIRGGDFSGCLFFNILFTKAIMDGADFSKAVFFSCSFQESSIKNANFQDAIIANLLPASFIEADCQYTNFTRSSFTNCKFQGANFSGCDFSDATLENCYADSLTKIDGVCFNGCTIKGEKKIKESIFNLLSEEQKHQFKIEEVKGVGSKKCFIATSCFGNSECPEVIILRKFRDQHLLKSNAGRWFVQNYYSLSPPIAKILSNHPNYAKIVRNILLKPVILFLQNHVN